MRKSRQMFTTKIVSLLVASLMLVSGAQGGLGNVSINARAQLDSTRNVYLYSYTVSNPSTSTLNIKDFNLDISRLVGSVAFDSSGLAWVDTMTQNRFARVYVALVDHIIVVSVSASPTRWVGDLSNSLTVDWFTSRSYAIHPNNALSGFGLQSKGVPGIRVALVSPFIDLDQFPSMDELGNDDAVDSLQNVIDSLKNASSVKVRTIGPMPPPSPGYPLVILDTLASYVVQSRFLGWITTQQIADKYISYFNSVRSNLQSANISSGRSILQTVLAEAGTDSLSTLTSEAYALIRYNTEYLYSQLRQVPHVKGGIFTPQGTSNLSVRAKSDSAFTSADTLLGLTATIRWPANSSVMLGSVSSPTFGFSKYDSVTTVGNYRYQKFRMTARVLINWAINTEYELFTVSTVGGTGAEMFALTNELPGGQWFVDIDYLDKSDTLFYQASAGGYAFDNRSDNPGSPFASGGRRLALNGNYLHEIYASGNEIIYRRKNLSGTWDVTTMISNGTGNCNDPCVIVAHDGSIHAVWQMYLSSTNLQLWYNRSTDGGLTWGAPTTIGPNITINSGQVGAYPRIAEWNASKLVIVTCINTGLQFTTSSNLGVSWAVMQPISGSGGGYAGYIWFPNLATGEYSQVPATFVILTYDTRYNGVYSRLYDGTTWLTEQNVNAGTGTYYDRVASVGVDFGGHPIAAWSAQGSGIAEYRIMYKLGNSDGSWGSAFVSFASTPGISDLYPSITYASRGGVYGVDIVYTSSSNQIKVNKSTSGSWQSPIVLSGTGAGGNTSHQDPVHAPGFPIRMWTDQTASPYREMLSSDGSYNLTRSADAAAVQFPKHRRRVVVTNERTNSALWFDLLPLKVVTSGGDTLEVPYRPLDMSHPFSATLANAWDYLGSDTTALPANGRFLLLETNIGSSSVRDTTGKGGTDIFTSRSFTLQVQKNAQLTSLISDPAAIGGKRSIDITRYAGNKVTFRIAGAVPAAVLEKVSVGIGDIYEP